MALQKARWLKSTVIACLSFALGLGCFSIRALYTQSIIAEYAGQSMEISAELLDYPKVYDSYCRAEVLLSGNDLPKVKAILYDSSCSIADATPGQLLEGTVKAKAADVRYGEKYDYYFSRGFFLVLNTQARMQVRDGAFDLRTLPQKLRHCIKRAVEQIFSSDTAPFIKSLIVGDKSEFYNDTGLYGAFCRAGLMHTVAVSGMHIAFLIGFLQLILGVSPRSSFVCIALVWVFVAVSGFSPSAVRAGFMQSVLLTAPLVKRENDPITTLSAALAIILLQNPYAAASVSLQLSFAAMSGIILFGSKLYTAISKCVASKKLLKYLNYPIKILSCSMAVMVFTVPLSALHFGYISLLSPVSNILCLWAVSICFCGAFIACAVGIFFPAVGIVAAWPVSWVARYIFAVSKLLSGISFCTVYLNSMPTVLWLAATYALVIVAVASKLPVKYKLLLPTGLSAVALILALLTNSYEYSSGNGVVSVLDVGQGQCICLMSGGDTAMIDCGSIGSFDDAGETAGEYLISRGRANIDYLILTHLHADHCNGVAMLSELVDIDNIVINPNNKTETMINKINIKESRLVDVSYMFRYEIFNSLYSLEQQKEFGVLGIELKLVK